MISHFRDRRKDVDMIIIHSMGEFIGQQFAYDFLDEIGLSAHFLVDSTGNIFNGPDPSKVAFHAGTSQWKGESNLNEVSIGIELLVDGHHNWESFKEAIRETENFTDAHYKRTAKLCRDAMASYPKITKDRILRHSQVSGKDVRDDPKIDPGKGFDMERLKQLI